MRDGLASLPRLARTVVHLRPRQVTNRVWRGLLPTRIDAGSPPPRRHLLGKAVPWLPRPRARLGKRRFRLLDVERTVGPTFDAPEASALWAYTLHYFDGLMAPSETDGVRWMLDWIESVPAGAAPAWDAYPTSRRLANWVKYGMERPGGLPPVVASSMASQARWLVPRLEYHLMANHLLANATALAMAGLYFGGREGEAWREQGEALAERELAEQFLDDGGHYERSPVYHAVILEDLLDLLNAYGRAGISPPAFLPATVGRAGRWLDAMTMADGTLPLINDAAHGVASEPSALRRYADALGVAAGATPSGLELLASSGFLRYRHGSMDVVADVGPPGPDYQPGHAHCGMLSFGVWQDGVPVLVDTGTSTYERGDRRMVERGTGAHNTVQVEDLEQSEIWAGFRMARRARLVDRSADDNVLTATLRGFPPAWVEHTRTWRFDGGAMVVEDRTDADRLCTARFHVHPHQPVEGRGDRWRSGGLELVFSGAESVRPVPYRYAPRFNVTEPATVLEVAFTRNLETRVVS